MKVSENFYDLKKCAELLNLPQNEVRILLKNKVIKGEKQGNMWLVYRADLVKYMEGQR
jgi:excisionase family DNA binding protein